MSRPAWTLVAALALAAALAAPAHAAPDLDGGGPMPICADRPTKGTSPCTVDAGHWQIESDAADYTHDRSGGVTTEAGMVASTNFKYGVSDGLDLELNLTPLQTLSVSGQGSTSGIGDTVARAKIALLKGADAVSLLPFVKLPSAPRSLGNGAVEGGLVVPVALALPSGLTLTLDPEVDALKDAAGQGRHTAYVMAAGLSRALSATFTGSVELWGSQNQEPAGRVSQASFDLGVAWIPAKDQALQLDGGLNLGLNSATPDAEVYVGVSRRF